jgi:hypothetical protein
VEKKQTPEERRKQYEEAVKQAIAAFPYQRIEVAGEHALATWESIRVSHPGSSAVVVGDDEGFTRIVEGFTAWPGRPPRATPEQILEVAERLRHPEDLIAQNARDLARVRELTMQRLRDKPDFHVPPGVQLPPSLQGVFGESSGGREEMIAAMLSEHEPPLGEWPSGPMEAPELTVATDIRSGSPLEKVRIIVLPTADWTTIPAYLRWGGWNDCPAPENHVAALRSWRDRYGAELIGLSQDVMNIRVKKRPETREAALDLAREQYTYCSDIVDQGVETLSALAAILMQSDWWYFWWD